MTKLRAMIAAFALAAATAAPGATILETGSYAGGEDLFVSGGVGLGPGKYRFRLDLSGPADTFSGELKKTTHYNDYCNPDGNGVVYCGGDDTDELPLLDPLGPKRYGADVTVHAPYIVPYGGDGAYGSYSEDCCTYHFDILAPRDGTYVFSVSAIPEPSSWAMLLLGVALTSITLRRGRPATLPLARIRP